MVKEKYKGYFEDLEELYFLVYSYINDNFEKNNEKILTEIEKLMEEINSKRM